MMEAAVNNSILRSTLDEYATKKTNLNEKLPEWVSRIETLEKKYKRESLLVTSTSNEDQ